MLVAHSSSFQLIIAHSVSFQLISGIDNVKNVSRVVNTFKMVTAFAKSDHFIALEICTDAS